MRFFVGVTDNKWFKFLSEIKPDEVNFWRPSGMGFKTIDPGSPFLFKLHSPLNYIAGGGFFVNAFSAPLSLAWKAFGKKNGASDYSSLEQMIKSKRKGVDHDPIITCIVLNEPFWFPKELWIPVPVDWKSNIVTGKTYDTAHEVGARLLKEVQRRLARSLPAKIETESGIAAETSYGAEYLAKTRLGQGAFRMMVTNAYKKRCAITGERTLPVLEAGHIKPFAQDGPNRVNNGLLLRADIHILFDKGYITVTPKFKVEVSRSIKEEYENGREYYAYHGRELMTIPDSRMEIPNNNFLDWHNGNVFIG